MTGNGVNDQVYGGEEFDSRKVVFGAKGGGQRWRVFDVTDRSTAGSSIYSR